MTSTPTYLLIQVRRVHYDQHTKQGRKDNAPFFYQHVINIKEMCSDEIPKNDAWYCLKQVMIHYGDEGRGHYYLQFQAEGGRWFRVDDDHVSYPDDAWLY